MKKILLGLSILIFASCGNANTKSTETEKSSQSQFQWDFSKQRKFIYSFSQTVNGENKMDKERPAQKTYMTGVGHLNVRVKENNLADISLTDIEMEMIIFNEDGTPRDTMTQKAPTNVVQDMKPNGGLVIGIIWANKQWRGKGTIWFISRIIATPELDNTEEEKDKTITTSHEAKKGNR